MTDKLIEGFKSFCASQYKGDDALMPQLVSKGQKPEYFVIGCIDSRSNAGTIFQAPPGTLFAFKSMGAIVRLYKKGTALAAALQFALDYCGVKKIIVLGHTHCGAVKALSENIQDEEIATFIDIAQAALEKARDCCSKDHLPEELLRKTEQEIVLQSIENLKTYPSVARALKEKRLEIKPWIFDMRQGDLLEHVESLSPLGV